MNVPAELLFTKEHEWAKKDSEHVVVGISEYAQEELGDVVFVDLPEAGKAVKKGESLLTIESVKAVSDVYAPVDGTVLSVNEQLNDSPELLNSSPYEDGWMVTLQPENQAQLAELLDASTYESFLGEISK